ncbi:GNAT family N-acetyltransferase [Robertmurraya kyonggiensis]|uniref:GNAT family N-acetyltransferase n=1 Tax=Robertmurraya kyonggiensis TaxID=1037680 RepID=A0A4U1D0L9_9BACI|nr:GNAT family N-acetyltransferase [Robertmurraya kyonggiensis]TKC15288.1 GNAT family N-acetyltransferase [Robertmurraya kyonggiensis]
MGRYEVKQIKNLLDFNLNRFLEKSKEEGFRFVERLVNDYKDGSNTFNHFGEGLFGVFNEEGVLVAIGGLNNDPFSKEQYIGRLRRFYVIKEYRRTGIGSLLVTKIIDEAKRYYKILVLHTDSEQADKFYTSIGFIKTDFYPNSSHYMELKS